MRSVLVIDDNPAVHTALEVLFSLADIRTLSAHSPEDGLQRLAREPVGLVVQDMNFSADTTSGDEGALLFRAIRDSHPDLPIILLTAWTHLEKAIELIKAGAADYFGKPWDDRKLLASVENLLELGQANREALALKQHQRQAVAALYANYDLRGMIIAAPASERLVALACQIARADVPVLITGPHGSGKDGIAQIVQANSAVRNGPFITVNCGALPSELIEAELFGTEAGAYTGATRARDGKFDAADGGTLFLDEIGNLSPAGQMKLLRVLQNSEFERLGSSETRRVDVRVLCATNANLTEAIAQGRFRQDLYFRLNVIELAVPSLRDRPEDLLPIAQSVLDGLPPARSGGRWSLSPEALRAMFEHPWPGNVRELMNRIQRAVLVATGDSLSPADLGFEGAPGSVAATPPLAPGEKSAFEELLRRHGGSVSRAAQELGLSRQALYRRMERLGIVLERRPR